MVECMDVDDRRKAQRSLIRKAMYHLFCLQSSQSIRFTINVKRQKVTSFHHPRTPNKGHAMAWNIATIASVGRN